jgi:hypothetical protein
MTSVSAAINTPSLVSAGRATLSSFEDDAETTHVDEGPAKVAVARVVPHPVVAQPGVIGAAHGNVSMEVLRDQEVEVAQLQELVGVEDNGLWFEGAMQKLVLWIRAMPERVPRTSFRIMTGCQFAVR